MDKKLTKGITLLELVVALGIITIVSTGIFVSTRNNTNTERRTLQNASYALRADIRYAQRRSIIEGHSYGIIFQRAYNRYLILREVGILRTVATIDLQSKGIRIDYISGGHNQVFFKPRGTARQSFTITLATENYRQEITIVPSGGRAYIRPIQRT